MAVVPSRDAPRARSIGSPLEASSGWAIGGGRPVDAAWHHPCSTPRSEQGGQPMLRPSRRSRSLTRCVLSAAALWLGSVATPAPSAQVLPQPLGPEVLLRLPERQAEIRRQKFLDPETNAIVQRNEITEPTGGTRLLTD